MAAFLIKHGGGLIEYEFIHRRRLRHIKISVSASGQIFVSAPFWVGRKKAEEFLSSKAGWVADKVREISVSGRIVLGEDRKDYLKRKKEALVLATERLEYFNSRFYHLPVKKILIANQKSRWGSCSASGHIRYNYRILDIPPAICDYVIVHELCHIKEMNHSPRFWRLVSETVPDWREKRRFLRRS